jgi:NADPH2:quinone reductase
MRALVFDGPAGDTSTTRVADLENPVPGPGELTIDVVTAGVNFIDVMARRGDPGYADAWPFVPGLEVAGHVRALGARVDGPPVGTRVAAFVGRGGLAEVARAHAALVAPVPDGVDWVPAAAAGGTLVTASLLLHDVARLRVGEHLVVHSAGGGVGQALAQLAPLAGAGRVIGVVGHRERVAPALAAGYDAVLVRDEDVATGVREATRGCGADVVLDPLGTTQLELDLALSAPGARIVLYGNATGGVAGPLPGAGPLFALNASIGAFSLSRMAAQIPQRVAGALQRVLQQLDAGQVTVPAQELNGLGAVAEVHDELATGRGSGKRVVRLRTG